MISWEGEGVGVGRGTITLVGLISARAGGLARALVICVMGGVVAGMGVRGGFWAKGSASAKRGS